MFLLLVVFLLAVPCEGEGTPGKCCENHQNTDEYSCNNWCVYNYDERYGYCDAIYIPGGPQIHLEPIEAPTATLKENSCAQVAKDVGFAASMLGDLVDPDGWVDGFQDFAKGFAKRLGIFGCVLSGLGSLNTPTPYDVIDAVNKALAELTTEINDQFKNMEAYVDQSIMQAQADAMQTFLNYFGSKFSNCILETSEERFLDCLDQTERDIHAASSSFMHYKVHMTDSSWVATSDDVKRMELEFITFMDYAILRTVNLLVMYGTYNEKTDEDGKLQSCRFLNDMKIDLTSFIDYTNYLYNTIYNAHNQSTTNQFFLEKVDKGCDYNNCQEIYEGWGNVWTATKCTCKFHLSVMLVDTDQYRCSQVEQVRRDNACYDYCTFYSSSRCDEGNDGKHVMHCKAQEQIYPLYVEYTKNMVTSVKNYWQPQTLNRLTTWRENSDQVDAHLQEKGCDTIKSEL